MTTQSPTLRKTISIKSKLIIQGLGVLAGTIIVTAVTFSSVNQIKVQGPLYKSIVADKDLLADILPPPAYIIESYLTAHRMADVTPAELPAIRKEASRLKDEYEARMTYWSKELAPGPVRETLLSTAAEPARAFFKIVDDKLIPAVEAGNNDLAREVVERDLSPLYARHRASIDALVPLVTASAAENETVAAARVNTGLWTMFATSAAMAVGCAVMCWLIGTNILMGIKRARKFADALAAGDLTVRAKMKSTDELGQLGSSLDEAMRSIEALLIDVGSNATQVAGAATQIAAAAEEMSASVTEVTRQTAQCTDSAKNAGESATQGGQTVEHTISEIHKIEQAVSASAASVSELGKRGEEIGEVIAVINDIADQTNLLALNAAIEAARAGEHGRGFAVVADEVRKLAERTTKATEQVASSIQSIQTETKQAVERMAKGTEQVKTGVQLAQQAGDNLRQIVDGSSEVAMLVQSISSASQEAGAGAQESASAAADLSTKAEHLLELIKQFKVSTHLDPVSGGKRSTTVRGNRSSGAPA